MNRQEVEYKCGHKGYINIFNKKMDVDRKVNYIKKHNLCPTCYAESQALIFDFITMSYFEYMQGFSAYKIKPGSYDKRKKTVVVCIPKAC